MSKITDDEKSAAQRTLDKCREQEKKKKNLVPVLVAYRTWVMMPKDATKEQIEAMKKKYNEKN